ncbi:hypothetical protein E2542_SST20925 [Spatholobus suberectus]|nr:hypothetical protein E2542_SST20925 [Spatholobus suberectus]
MLTPKLIPPFYFNRKAEILSLNKSNDLSSSPFVNEISSHDGEVEESSPLCACICWKLLFLWRWEVHLVRVLRIPQRNLSQLDHGEAMEGPVGMMGYAQE